MQLPDINPSELPEMQDKLPSLENSSELGNENNTVVPPALPTAGGVSSPGANAPVLSESEFAIEGGQSPILAAAEEDEKRDERRRKWLLLLLLLLLLMLCCCGGLFVRYIQKPKPLPELLPVPVNVNYPPHYLFSIYGLDKPVGVGISPQNDRIYVAETGGERLVKIFDRDGALLGSFSPPRTNPGERSPVYVATDSTGRVFITDRLQHVIYVYDREGKYLDTILSPTLALSEYVSKHAGSLPPGSSFAYSIFQEEVYYQYPGKGEQTLPSPDLFEWNPLGIRIDANDQIYITDVLKDQNLIRILAGQTIMSASWQNFNPPELSFGTTGQESGQILFPNIAVTDASGRIFVTDGNNGRVDVFDNQGRFLFSFGKGTGDGAVSLPRGATIDKRNRLYVTDAVGQDINVYDISADEPAFLFTFGDYGLDDGLFNYPNDIVVDGTGRLYIADRENNRVQVWSY